MLPEQRDALIVGADALGASLTPAQCDTLLDFQALLVKWNRVYNLTAVRDPAEMLTHHLLDSLAAWPPLKRHLGTQSAKLLDVGSGGGLPGVVLAVMAPQLDVTCVDAVGKKAIFIRQVAAELRLPNLYTEHERVENLRVRKPFDVITSRAFASLTDFVELTEPLLAGHGVWTAMKGKTPSEELASLPPQFNVFHVEQLSVPGLNADRCLVWMRRSSKEEPTP